MCAARVNDTRLLHSSRDDLVSFLLDCLLSHTHSRACDLRHDAAVISRQLFMQGVCEVETL